MTRTVVVGGGPIGIFTGVALARRGHDVVLVDRDPGPKPDGSWRRMGVMQFLHPHFYRPAVHDAFQAEMPDLWDALMAAGAEPRPIPGAPPTVIGLACRRSVFERTLREFAQREPGLAMCVGHVDRIVVEDGIARGVQVDGSQIDADLVVSVSGRTSPLGHELRGAHEGGLCGFSYVSRMYRTRPGRDDCDLPAPSYAVGDGYITVALPQDAATLSVLVSAPSNGPALAGLRENAGFDAAGQAIPNLAPWTDPERFEPLTDVLVGGGLTNTYFPQGPEPGVPPAVGLFFIGDAVCTTNPAAGRGIALGLLQARELLRLIDDESVPADDASRALDAWCDEHLKPWYADHVHWDASLLERFSGQDIDVDAPLPSDVIIAAGQVDADMMPTIAMFMGMVIGPKELRSVEDKARAVLKSGWRPPYAGPTAVELADLVNRAVAAAAPAPTLTRA